MTRALVGPEFWGVHRRAIREENRARVFGISETIFMVVAVIGPPLGGWLADTYGFQVHAAVRGGTLSGGDHHPGGDGAHGCAWAGDQPAKAHR